MNQKLFTYGLLPLLAMTASAKTPTTSTNPIAQQSSKIRTPAQSLWLSNTNRLMTHLALAARALDSKDKTLASSNLLDAKTILELMKKKRPEVISDYLFVYGKTRVTEERVDKDYYFPVADDVAVEDIYTKNVKRGQPLMQVKAVDLINTGLQLNIKSVEEAIEAAQAKLKAGDLPAARQALNEMTRDALTSQVVVQDPLWKVWGDMNLAQNFMAQKEYPSARFSLEAATVELRRLESSKTLQKNGPDAKTLLGEINQMKKELATDSKPSTIQRFTSRLHQWISKVKTWI